MRLEGAFIRCVLRAGVATDMPHTRHLLRGMLHTCSAGIPKPHHEDPVRAWGRFECRHLGRGPILQCVQRKCQPEYGMETEPRVPRKYWPGRLGTFKIGCSTRARPSTS